MEILNKVNRLIQRAKRVFIKDPPKVREEKLTMPEAVKRVSEITGFTAHDLQGKKKNTPLVAARALFALVCRKASIPETEICSFLNKDRTALVHYRTDYKPTRNYRLYYDIYEKKFGKIQ